MRQHHQTPLRLCIALTALVASTSSVSAEEALLVGGGYEPVRSEARIEQTVAWIQQVLTERGMDVQTWFTDGNAPGPDVFTTSSEAAADANTPLARVFGEHHLEARQYRENQVPNIAGGTDATDLLPALVQSMDSNEDPKLLVFNGHGSESQDTQAGVTMDLWNNTSLSARELHTALDANNSPLRWVFTQCYSGGFHRLAYENPDKGLNLTEARRCGFTAESAYRQAEGCSASLDIGDYRDYSTYFFAALAGTERTGEITISEPDLNNDGVTSPREAHLFTLQNGHSSDLSRSTSEDYLEAWQPWYLRWLPLRRSLPDNEYAKVYREIAARLQIPLDSETPATLRSQIAGFKREHDELQQQRESLRNDEAQLQGQMIQDLSSRWPALVGPYTAGYAELVSSGELTRIAQAIMQSPDYLDLVTLQDSDDTLDAPILEAERSVVQRLKLLRLRRIAHLVDQLDRHGNDAAKRDYAELISCEEQPLTGS